MEMAEPVRDRRGGPAPSCRSLIDRGLAYKVQFMFARIFGRQIAALVLALGVFLGGVGPSWAAPVSSIMPGMTMSDMPMNCAEMEKSQPDKPMPCNGSDSCCAVCTTCVVNVGAPQGFSLQTLFYRGEVRAVSRDAGHNSLAWPPPLPPPILHA